MDAGAQLDWPGETVHPSQCQLKSSGEGLGSQKRTRSPPCPQPGETSGGQAPRQRRLDTHVTKNPRHQAQNPCGPQRSSVVCRPEGRWGRPWAGGRGVLASAARQAGPSGDEPRAERGRRLWPALSRYTDFTPCR